MDDFYLGARSKCTPGTGDKSGGGSDKSRIIIALSKVDGKPKYLKMLLAPGPVRKEDVKGFAPEAVAKGSHLTTDNGGAYNGLDKMGFSHTAKVYYKQGPEFLKWLHVIISNVKSLVSGTYHGLDETHLQAYLTEICYRFNRRWDADGLFDRLTLACATGQHLGWSRLVIPPKRV